MVQPLNAIGQVALEQNPLKVVSARPAGGDSFANVLQGALQQVSQTAGDAAAQSVGLLTGETTSVHNVVLAAEKADLVLRLTLQVRNKALDAYNEIMRMQF